MIKSKNFLILVIIFILSLSIRLYQSDNYPPLLWDEAALGYNAYSILQTGKDEYGTTLPLIFKSFGDYKPGIYIYLTVPFVALFGLNQLSVRLPSIILGSLIPIFFYLLITKISPKSTKTALISALLLAINPFNLHFSRGAWETNILTFQLILIAYFVTSFFNSPSKNKISLLIAALISGLSLYTYQAAKLITPLILLSLLIIHRQKISKTHLAYYLFLFILPLFIFSIPIAKGLFFSSDSNRLKVVSLFSYPRSPQETATYLQESNQIDYQIFHSQPFFFTRNFLSRYFNFFSPQFLTFQGDWQNLRHSAPYIGVLLYPSIIFFLIGLFSKDKNSKIKLFFTLWLLFAPLPAAITRDSITAVRAMSFSLPLIYFAALGLSQSLKFLSDKNIFIKTTATSLIIFAYILSFAYYADLYLNHLVKKDPSQYLYGYHQVIDYVSQNYDKFQQIYITDFYGQPYIYYLFFTKYPPSQYQSQALLVGDSLDTGKVEQIDNIHFGSSSYQKALNSSQSLTIFSHDEILRQDLHHLPDFQTKFIPLSPINHLSTFYAFQN